MKQHLKYILLLLVFIGTLKQSIAQTTISSSVTLTQTVLNGYSWPVTINGGSVGSPVIVTLGEDVTLSNVQNYFVINGEYVTIDGNGKTIILSNITNYRGLVNNGNYLGNTWSAAFPNTIVKNIGVLSNNSSLNEYCGWIGQQGYGNGAGFSITNCYSNGEMTNDGSGGILGQAYMNGTISNCYSLGNISGNYTAGIVADYNQDASRIINCYANGTISGSNANGICMPDMMMMPGMSGGASFTNCYAANGVFNTSTANSNLTGTDGTVWNTSVNPYTLSVFYNNLGLLNTRPTSAAYSLRLLYPNYTGPLARININGSFYDIYPDNSSSKIFSLNSTISNSYNSYNATATGATSNLISSIVSANTTASVAIWYDQSGNNVHAEQSSTNAQPRIINAGTIDHKNGYPAITFQRSEQYLETVSNLTVQTINTVRALPWVYYHTLVAMPANTDFSVKGDNYYNSFYNISPDQNDWSYGTSPNNTWVNGNQNVNYAENNIHTAIIAAQNPRTSNLSISSTYNQIGMQNGAFLNELVLFPDNLTSLERTTIENNQLLEYTIGFITTDISPNFQTVALNGTPKNLSITSSKLNATFQWYSNSNNNNSGGTLINGATNNTYTPETTNDGDLYYYVIVSANNKTLASEVSLVRTVITTGSGSSIYSLSSNDYPESLTNDVSGNIYFLNRDNSSGNNIYTIKKLDIFGSLSNLSTISSSTISNYFQVSNLLRDNNGNFYYQSVELINNSYYKYSINKIHANGNISVINSTTNGYFYSMIIDNVGNLYYILNENSNFYINKIEATNGNSTNLLTSSANNINYNRLKFDLQGNLYFIKNEYSSNLSTNSIIKIDNNGNNLVSLVSLTGTNSSSYYIGRNINNFEILNSGEIKFIQQNYYYDGSQSTQSLQVKKIDGNGNVNVLYNDSTKSSKNSYTYISNNTKDNLDNIFYVKVSYIQNNQESLIYQVDNLNNSNILNIYNTYISSITSDNIGNLYYSLPELHQIIKLPIGVSAVISKWGLSPNGLKTQDNTIQIDINGKKGTSSPVNENGKVN